MLLDPSVHCRCYTVKCHWRPVRSMHSLPANRHAAPRRDVCAPAERLRLPLRQLADGLICEAAQREGHRVQAAGGVCAWGQGCARSKAKSTGC